jgi:hypothetical protein
MKSEMHLIKLFLTGNTSRFLLSFLETSAPDPGRSILGQEEFTFFSDILRFPARYGNHSLTFLTVCEYVVQFMYYK